MAQGFNRLGLVIHQQVAPFGESQSVLLDEFVVRYSAGQGRGRQTWANSPLDCKSRAKASNAAGSRVMYGEKIGSGGCHFSTPD